MQPEASNVPPFLCWEVGDEVKEELKPHKMAVMEVSPRWFPVYAEQNSDEHGRLIEFIFLMRKAISFRIYNSCVFLRYLIVAIN